MGSIPIARSIPIQALEPVPRRKRAARPLTIPLDVRHAEIVPELISMDDWGYPIVDTRAVDDERLLQHARRAVATCPRLALLIEEFKAECRV